MRMKPAGPGIPRAHEGNRKAPLGRASIPNRRITGVSPYTLRIGDVYYDLGVVQSNHIFQSNEPIQQSACVESNRKVAWLGLVEHKLQSSCSMVTVQHLHDAL